MFIKFIKNFKRSRLFTIFLYIAHIYWSISRLQRVCTPSIVLRANVNVPLFCPLHAHSHERLLAICSKLFCCCWSLLKYYSAHIRDSNRVQSTRIRNCTMVTVFNGLNNLFHIWFIYTCLIEYHACFFGLLILWLGTAMTIQLFRTPLSSILIIPFIRLRLHVRKSFTSTAFFFEPSSK